MAFFRVKLPTQSGQFLVGRNKGFIVEADSATFARQLAAAQVGGDQDWINAAVTAEDISTLSASDYLGWKYRLTIREPTQGGTEGKIHEVEYTGVASDTVDIIGAELVAALLGSPASAAIAEDGGVFTDETTLADDRTADNVTLFPATPVAATDRYNIGFTSRFGDLKVDVTTVGTGTYTVVWEYWNGTAWAALSGVAGAGADFKTLGVQPVTFTVPSDWATNTINSQGPFYYVRAEIQTGTVTAVPLARRLHIGTKTTASYSSPTLTAAAVADNIGNKSLQLKVFPANSTGEEMPAMVGAITDEGVAAAVLDVALIDPTAIPVVIEEIKR